MGEGGFKPTALMTAAAFLVLSLIPLGAGYIRGHQIRADQAAFASDGVQTVGKVLNKTSEFYRNSMRYTVYFEYKAADGVTYQESELLPGSTSYDGYRIGGPITLTYLRSQPNRYYLPEYTPNESYAHIFDIFFYGGAVGTFVSFAWIVLAWPKGSGDGGAPAMPRSPESVVSQATQTRAAPVVPRTTPTRAQGFGRRGA